MLNLRVSVAANGVILDKIIIGKPAIAADANDGYIPTAALRTCIAQAQQGGYQGGLALWQYPDQVSNYVAQVSFLILLLASGLELMIEIVGVDLRLD